MVDKYSPLKYVNTAKQKLTDSWCNIINSSYNNYYHYDRLQKNFDGITDFNIFLRDRDLQSKKDKENEGTVKSKKETIAKQYTAFNKTLKITVLSIFFFAIINIDLTAACGS